MKKIKKYLPEILAILIPIIIILIGCKFTDIYPFGKYAIAKYDGATQYPAFTINFRNAILGKNSLFYSFGGSLGYNFYATAIYYLFNPTNLLCVFAKESTIMNYYLFIILLRVGLSGFTMCKYLRYKFKNQSNTFYTIFSISYALMGYTVAYYHNYMYFDNVVFFPILIMGLDKLIHERKNKLYIFMLTISILSNFYIGYMECIFSLLYFIYSYINLKKKDKKIIKDFIISSMLSGIMCAVTLLPVFLELLNGKLEHFTVETQTNYFEFNTNFVNFFYKLMPGTLIENDVKYGSVNIYVSMLVAVLVIKYFFLNNVSKKEKITTLIFILFLILSVSFNLIDYAWHMFQRPIWYPNRYSFMISFLLIIIGAKTYINLDNVKQNLLFKIVCTGVFICLTVYPFLQVDLIESRVKVSAYVFGIILLLEYMFLLENKKARMLLISMFFLELIFNTMITFDNLECYNTIENLNDILNRNVDISNTIKESDPKTNNFYRVHIEKNDMLSTGGSLFGYNGLDSFNSIKNTKLLHFLNEQLEYTVKNMTSLEFDGKNPYMTSILGIKYISGKQDETYYENVNDKYQATNMYKNSDALSIGFMVNKNIKNFKSKNNKYDNTEEIVNLMQNSNNKTYGLLNEKIIYKNTKEITREDTKKTFIRTTDKDNEYIIEGTIKKDGFITFNEMRSFYTMMKVYINDKEVESFNTSILPRLLKKGDKYKIVFITNNYEYLKEYTDVYITYLDEYKDFINNMKSNQLEITKYEKDDYIKSTINVSKDKTTLFTTIPYNKGWNVYVDNKKVNYDECLNSLICLDLNEGKHTIEFKFIPRGLIIGSIISLITLGITIIYVRKK